MWWCTAAAGWVAPVRLPLAFWQNWVLSHNKRWRKFGKRGLERLKIQFKKTS